MPENIVETANYIKKYFNEPIDYAVVLGSGITLELEEQQELGYEAVLFSQEINVQTMLKGMQINLLWENQVKMSLY